jgi:hypothetical protein
VLAERPARRGSTLDSRTRSRPAGGELLVITLWKVQRLATVSWYFSIRSLRVAVLGRGA